MCLSGVKTLTFFAFTHDNKGEMREKRLCLSLCMLNQFMQDKCNVRITLIKLFNWTMHCVGLWSGSFELTGLEIDTKTIFRSDVSKAILIPPLSIPVLQAVEECCVVLALYVSVTQLTRQRLSVFARDWTVHPWWHLFAAQIHPPTPMSVSWRKPSVTHSDASRFCARDPAVSTITY